MGIEVKVCGDVVVILLFFFDGFFNFVNLRLLGLVEMLVFLV